MPPRTRAAATGNELSFKSKKRQKKAIKFDLDGEEYTFTPPKNAMMVLPLLDGADGASNTKMAFDWLGAGLPEAQTEKIIARLKDPKDNLDVDDIAEVVFALAEKVGGDRPTT